MRARSIRVGEAEAGQRLDVVVANELGITRGYVRRLIGHELVLLAGQTARKGAMLRRGDLVEFLEFRHPSEGPAPNSDLPVSVLREDLGLVAVDKPAGTPTHPLDYEEKNSLLNGLLARYPGLAGVGEGGLLSGVVHRLDVLTSGVQLFATEAEAWQRARQALSERSAEKRYVARVHGRLNAPSTLVLRLENRGDHVRVVSTGGREAITQLAPLEPGANSSLVELRPITGLRHQLRASLAHLGHPVVGDPLYGSTAELSRHLLHAHSIRIGNFTATSPVPEEFGES